MDPYAGSKGTQLRKAGGSAVGANYLADIEGLHVAHNYGVVK